MFRSFALVMALFLVGCGGDDEKPAPAAVCEAGRVVECPCPGGTMAVQECKADGSAWGACACPVSETVPELQCSLPQDQSEYLKDERCPTGEVMYARCEREIVLNGVCTEKPFGMFCCPR